jgi:hypothetical protein
MPISTCDLSDKYGARARVVPQGLLSDDEKA